MPSPAAIVALREAAAALDVIDVVDLCYAMHADELRVSIYLESLRGRGGEAAQVAACLLCFDLARRGDERRMTEVSFLLPAIDELIQRDARGEKTVVRELTSTSDSARALWDELVAQARQRDLRAEADVADIAVDVDIADVEVDLFDENEFNELAITLEDIDLSFDLDDEVLRAFDAGLNAVIPNQPALLFSAESAADLERLERLRAHCQSFQAKLPIAAELLAMTELFIATHTRAAGLFGRRNRRRDRTLTEGIATLLALPEPPAEAIAWFEAGDLPGSDDLAWPKMCEVLLELCRFVDADRAAHPARYRGELSNDAWARGVAEAFVADDGSAKIPQRLADSRDRRRRR